MDRRTSTAWRLRALLLLAGCLTGCGERSESDDDLCDGQRAFSEKPTLGVCSEVRTIESMVDPRSGKTFKGHRILYCCW